MSVCCLPDSILGVLCDNSRRPQNDSTRFCVRVNGWRGRGLRSDIFSQSLYDYLYLAPVQVTRIIHLETDHPHSSELLR